MRFHCKSIVVALSLALSACAGASIKTPQGRLALADQADAALSIADGLADTAAAEHWVSPETAAAAHKAVAAAQTTVQHARAAFASPACLQAQGDQIDAACGVQLALQALGAAADIMKTVQKPAVAAVAAPNA